MRGRVLLSALVLACAVLVAHASPSCATHAGCTACLLDPRCGWCGDGVNGLCREGSSAGPGDGGAACVSWQWESCPVAPCASFSTCNACVGQTDCGWCATTNTCLQGSVVSPRSSVCPAWQFTDCPGNVPGVAAFLDNSRSSVTLQFDLAMALQVAELPCSAYFASVLSLGVAPRCVWLDARQMTVFLGTQYAAPLALDLGPGIASGLFATLAGGVAPAPGGPVAVAAAPNPVPPLVLIQGPAQVTLCDTQAVLDASGTLGVAVEAVGTTATWTWTLVSGVPTPGITLALASATGPVLVLNAADLATGASYTFQLTVRLGTMLSFAQHTLMLNAAPLVDVTVTTPSALTVYASDELIMRAVVRPCSSLPGTVYSYAWTKTSGPNVVLDTATQVTSTYRIPPNTLTGYVAGAASATYVFQCAVSLDDKLPTVGRAFVTLHVLLSPLVAAPAGMQLDTRLARVRIDAAAHSQDADAAPLVPSYAWNCREAIYPAPPCVISFGPAATVGGVVDFPGANLHPGDWPFSLIYSKGTRRARAVRVVTMDWDDSPSATIVVVDPSALQFVAVGSAAQREVLVNRRQPLVLEAVLDSVGDAPLRSVRWTALDAAIDLTAAPGVDGALLFVAPLTLVAGRRYTLMATIVNELAETTNVTFVFTVNDEPRIVTGPGCSWVPPVPATVAVLGTVLAVRCAQFTDDSAHYPLGYATRQGSFAQQTGFAQAVDFDMVLVDDSAVLFGASDSLGAGSRDLPLPLPAGTVVQPAFVASAGAASLLAAVQRWICLGPVDPVCRAGSLQEAVDEGSVERIDQVAMGIVKGITLPGVAYSAAQLALMRSHWSTVKLLLARFFVAMPSHLWAINEGVKLQAQSSFAALLDSTRQLQVLDDCASVWARWRPGTQAIGNAYVPVLSLVVDAMEAAAVVETGPVRQLVSSAWVHRVWTLLAQQVAGGAAVAHTTVTATGQAPRLTTAARNDTFDAPSALTNSRVRALTLSLTTSTARRHTLILSAAAAASIGAVSPGSHGLLGFAVDYDLFSWSSSPRTTLASDVVGFQATTRSTVPVDDAVGAVEVRLEATPALLAARPVNTSLVCAHWVTAGQRWGNTACTLQSLTATVPVTASCACNTLGIFALVWAPLLASPGPSPLLPLGPRPNLVAPWLPIVVALLLLLLLALLLAAYFWLMKPRLYAVLGQAEEEPLQSVAPVDDWSTHLNRPNLVHVPGQMAPDQAIILYDATSSGEDDWPSNDQPDLTLVAAPLFPRAPRQPFVGGRVALLREVGGGEAPPALLHDHAFQVATEDAFARAPESDDSE